MGAPKEPRTPNPTPADRVAPCGVRQAVEDDLNLIRQTWIGGMLSNSPWAKNTMTSDVFSAGYRPIVEGLLSKESVSVLVGFDPEAPTVIWGYLVAETLFDGRKLIHYAYTKAPFRRTGVLRKLLAAAQCNLNSTTITNWTYDCSLLKQNHTLSYNPFILWENR